jgi:hypothetical protein
VVLGEWWSMFMGGMSLSIENSCEAVSRLNLFLGRKRYHCGEGECFYKELSGG